jgi:sulfite reductase alpha subunit-like flavoprotein
VQDLIREQSALVWESIQNGALILVCGDGKKMAPNVRRAFIDLFIKEGKMPEHEAEAFLKQLQQSYRYVEDVWA